MHIGKWVVGGLAGGIAGAAVWTAASRMTSYDVRWLACGVGFLVGLGVRFLARDATGRAPGTIAAVIAIGAVLLGKYLSAQSALEHEVRSGLRLVTPKDVIAEFARDLSDGPARHGRAGNMPEPFAANSASAEHDFPPGIWNQARQRWASLQPGAQQAELVTRNRALLSARRRALALERPGGAMTMQAFQRSFGALDLLWMALATFLAYRLGSGAAITMEEPATDCREGQGTERS